MRLDEAIKIKEEYRREHFYGYNPRFIEADDLSIEASKRIDYCRSGEFNEPFELLPGETLE